MSLQATAGQSSRYNGLSCCGPNLSEVCDCVQQAAQEESGIKRFCIAGRQGGAGRYANARVRQILFLVMQSLCVSMWCVLHVRIQGNSKEAVAHWFNIDGALKLQQWSV